MKIIIVKKCKHKHKKCKKHKKRGSFAFHAIYRVNNQIIVSEVKMLILLDNQKVSLEVVPVSVKGNVAQLDGVPVWSVSDESLVTVEPSEDGLSAVVKAIGPVGIAQVAVKGDADLGEGVVEITGTLDVEIQASSAASFTINAGIPEENV